MTTQSASFMTTSPLRHRDDGGSHGCGAPPIRALAVALLLACGVAGAIADDASRGGAATPDSSAASTGVPELKPVAGVPVSMWWNSRTGNFKGAAQVWGELRNDSSKRFEYVRVRFSSYDASGTV